MFVTTQQVTCPDQACIQYGLQVDELIGYTEAYMLEKRGSLRKFLQHVCFCVSCQLLNLQTIRYSELVRASDLLNCNKHSSDHTGGTCMPRLVSLDLSLYWMGQSSSSKVVIDSKP